MSGYTPNNVVCEELSVKYFEMLFKDLKFISTPF